LCIAREGWDESPGYGKGETGVAAERLNITPYARSASHAFQTKGALREWDNGWDNCWHNGDWTDGPHPWTNTWKNACSPNENAPAMLRDAILVRDDGFIHNRINEVVFYADKPSVALVKSHLDKPIRRLAETEKELMESLWLD
jgi:hypothetical protein